MLWRDVVLVGSQELRSPFTFKVPPSVLPVSLCVLPGCSGGRAAQVQADAQRAFSRLVWAYPVQILASFSVDSWRIDDGRKGVDGRWVSA